MCMVQEKAIGVAVEAFALKDQEIFFFKYLQIPKIAGLISTDPMLSFSFSFILLYDNFSKFSHL